MEGGAKWIDFTILTLVNKKAQAGLTYAELLGSKFHHQVITSAAQILLTHFVHKNNNETKSISEKRKLNWNEVCRFDWFSVRTFTFSWWRLRDPTQWKEAEQSKKATLTLRRELEGEIKTLPTFTPHQSLYEVAESKSYAFYQMQTLWQAFLDKAYSGLDTFTQTHRLWRRLLLLRHWRDR